MHMVHARTLFFHGLAAGAMVLLVSTGVFAQNPTTREYPTLYKSPRAMGMGGANTAVGGRVDTLFYNPAGLINIPQDKGWEVNLINVSAEYNKEAINFYKDMQDAFDVPEENGQQQKAVNDVLAKYSGQKLHVRAADLTSIGKSYGRWAFGVGGIGSGKLDAIPHQGFGSDGFLEVHADAMYGGIGGFSIGLAKNLFGGISAKYLHRETVTQNFTALDFVNHEDNLGDYIQKDLIQTGNALAFDAGVLWKLAPGSVLNPSLGVSVLNIGDLDFGKAGKIPQTVNAGIAITPAISAFRSLTVALDYIDIMNNFEQDKDMAKRLRYGAELQLFDIWQAEMALRAGMYEGSPTLGADLRLFVFTFSYVMYTEEIGAYAGQDKDKRQLLTVDIGW
jgi:hypothetical protein